MSERELTTHTAISRIYSIIHSLNLTATVKYATKNKLVATAELFDKQGILVESGAGKGSESLVGALAESLEHFATFHINQSEVATQPGDMIANQIGVECDGFLSSLANNESSIECYKLQSLDKRHDIYVPTIILNPQPTKNNFTTTSQTSCFLHRYSSNSGTAFGCTEAEALLHGIHEVIERHILSQLFIDICSLGENKILYSPSASLLETALNYDASSMISAKKLKIIIIKDVFDVFFAIALPHAGPGDMHLSPIGSGCSLDIKIAIQRAVSEQFQTEALYGLDEEANDLKILKFLASSKKLTPLIDFNTVKNLKLPLMEMPNERRASTVQQQITTLNQSLSRAGRKIYYRTLARFDECVVTQVYIPGLERFNLIRQGCLVAPQQILLDHNAKDQTVAPSC
ncbi:YcaO-like family protein [Pseudomonas rhodesiae]|jgi:ribosomal protein S12 methylthiotransferase accessory factor|uniref:YcaO-like family protein n=1 Tax=Pseudomonas rhodesiae TaxID=76760 RepID=UPI00209D54A2|nr:YcaO-like family protein [Pseudomonas rhodesiae]MCP1511368.1 ribosomal protein S12 methylthiotransferase accessory factor [Pseudomonas rhodesiae]MDF9770190.1 ribosomal protein S12 methylthiotransferase accessory factor [Pseudomonas rhodesiae]